MKGGTSYRVTTIDDSVVAGGVRQAPAPRDPWLTAVDAALSDDSDIADNEPEEAEVPWIPAAYRCN